ncbi:MAG: hypothetical protein JWL64_2812 [Frankiales bacterium]|nr:hypothetical protein [Frankiales bacterium]
MHPWPPGSTAVHRGLEVIVNAPLGQMDETAFLAADVRRRRSDEVTFGTTWRAASIDTWSLTWLRDTGELYLVRNDSLVGAASLLVVLTVVGTEREVDELLVGWQEAVALEEGLPWLYGRLELDAAA